MDARRLLGLSYTAGQLVPSPLLSLVAGIACFAFLLWLQAVSEKLAKLRIVRKRPGPRLTETEPAPFTGTSAWGGPAPVAGSIGTVHATNQESDCQSGERWCRRRRKLEHAGFAAEVMKRYIPGTERRSIMLLKKYRENKDALKQIGREALAESRRLGLAISAKDRQNEAKVQAKSERKERAHATVR